MRPRAARREAAVAEIECDHCGLPVPAGLVDAESETQFCCQGCRMVFETIRGCGLGRFYELRDDDESLRPARPGRTDYASFDEPTFRELHVSDDAAGAAVVELYVEALHCSACVWLIEKLPSVVPGVREARVNFSQQTVRVVWDPATVALSRIARGLDGLGYPVHPYRRGAMEDVRRDEDRTHLVRVGIAGACAGNVMLIAFALYGGLLHGMDERYRLLFRGASLLLTVVALIGPGRVFFTGAWSSLRTRVLHMDLPVALALAAGTIWGGWNTLRGAGEVYFESLTAVVFLLLVGRWIQHRQQRSARDAVEWLFRLTPSSAREVGEDGVVSEVPVEALRPGAVVELHSGDSVPADGELTVGTSEFDLSLLTGESQPVKVSEGQRVHAGTVNLSRPVRMRVSATGAETRVGRLMRLIETLARERTPIVRMADRVAHRFVITVLLCAAITVAVWWFLRPADAIENAIALLIVTCPCALGLATPLAVVAAIGRAARVGILIKGGEVIERLASPGTMFLDKTGTLTQGRTELVSWTGDDAVRPLVRAVEARIAHPVARALAKSLPLDPELEASEVVQELGRGVRGAVGSRQVVVGSPGFVRSIAGGVPGWVAGAERDCVERSLTPVFVAVDREVCGVAGVGDPIHEDAKDAVRGLVARGWTVGVLSGDHPGVVAAVARQLGISGPVEGGASPERKVEVVREASRGDTTVVMVGDGVNDAAAMTAAGVGVAVHGGVEASLAAADVYLRRPGLGPVVDLIRGAPRAVGVIRRNLLVSLVYNLLTGGLAAAGLINPLVAAVLMPLSSLTVVTLSFRSRTFGG